jgi:hypothetical protein
MVDKVWKCDWVGLAMKCNRRFRISGTLLLCHWWVLDLGFGVQGLEYIGNIPIPRQSPWCRAHAELIGRG